MLLTGNGQVLDVLGKKIFYSSNVKYQILSRKQENIARVLASRPSPASGYMTSRVKRLDTEVVRNSDSQRMGERSQSRLAV